MEDKGLRNRRIKIGALAGIAGVIGKAYAGPCQELINSYLADFIFPIGAYHLARTIRTYQEQRPILIAGAMFGASAIGEVAQGLGLKSGVYDPLDYLVYAAGAGLSILTEGFIFRQKPKKEDN